MRETIKHNLVPALLALLIFAPIAWVASDRTPPYKVISGTTIPPMIKAGGKFKIEWRLHPNHDIRCPGTVYLFMRDSAGVLFVANPRPASFGLLPVEGNEDITIFGSEHMLDPSAALGPAKIYVRLTFVCNFAQWLWPLELMHDVVNTEIVK